MQLQNLIIDNIRTFVFSIFVIDSHIFANISILLKNRSFFINIIFNFTTIVIIFSNIFCRYLENIYYNWLDIKNIIKFIVNFSSIVVSKKNNTFETKNINNLVCNFLIYIYIVISFTFQQSIKIELFCIILFYIFCLINIIDYKIFVFIKFYYKFFLLALFVLNKTIFFWTIFFSKIK